MAEPDALLALARAIGANARAAYGVGLGLVLLVTAATWATVHHPVWARARERAGEHISESMGLVARGGIGLAVIVVAAALFAEIAEHIGPDGRIARADDLLAATLRADLSTGTLQLFATFTRAGDVAVLTALGVGVALALWLGGRRLLAVGWVMAVGGNALLNPLLKGIFERVRPVHDHGFATETSWSFPSGHSSGAMVAYGMLAYLAVRLLHPKWHLPALLLAAGVIFTTGCSRILLQVHFASDVAAGFASGLAWLTVCVSSLEWRGRRDWQTVQHR